MVDSVDVGIERWKWKSGLIRGQPVLPGDRKCEEQIV
jgi:hypothetical protein